MGSQTDLDQGGTFRQTQSVYMGPSIGWVNIPISAVLPVTTGGTTTVQKGNTLVTVNFNGAVTIQLPTAKANAAGGMTIPAEQSANPLTVVDIGGFANAHNITILPFGSETIDGLASIAITTNYGAFTLKPDIVNGGWTLL
jgi:hypothetical protein